MEIFIEAIKKGSVTLALLAIIMFVLDRFFSTEFLQDYSAYERLRIASVILLAVFGIFVFLALKQSSKNDISGKGTAQKVSIKDNRFDGDLVMRDKINNRKDSK